MQANILAQQFICSEPGWNKEYSTKFALKRHMITHSGSKKYKCRFCDKSFVVLGAGFDTRCYGTLSGGCPNLYEIDLPNTQEIKIKTLKKANIDASKVNFVTADLRSGDWSKKLIDKGFDPTLKSVFLLEGITVYLNEDDVLDILTKISDITVKGSAVLVDFYSSKFVNFSRLPKKSEGYKFGLDLHDSNNFEKFIEKTNLKLKTHNYLGQRNNNGPFMVTAELIVK